MTLPASPAPAEAPAGARLLTVGSLCSGIGGLELGLEMTGGFRTLWQAEIDPYARAVLAKHWPRVQRLEDVRDVGRFTVSRVDLIAAGLPCQPHSIVGKRRSSDDARDLWGECARIVGDLEPRWLLVENVPGLLSSRDPAYGHDFPGAYFGRILSDLDALGYDAEWQCLRASDVGAPHRRERLFLLAHPRRERLQGVGPAGAGERAGGRVLPGRAPAGDGGAGGSGGGWQEPQPRIQRVAHGVPSRAHRIRTLGNAVVPQVARWVGEHILAAERAA